MSSGGIPIGQWSGSDAVNELHATIKTFNGELTKYQAENNKQTDAMLRLTRVIAWLTAIMLAAVVVQIGLAVWPVS